MARPMRVLFCPVLNFTINSRCTMGMLLLILLVLLLLGGMPTWGYSRSWGYGPSGVVGLLLILVLVLVVLNVVPWGFHPVVVR